MFTPHVFTFGLTNLRVHTRQTTTWWSARVDKETYCGNVKQTRPTFTSVYIIYFLCTLVSVLSHVCQNYCYLKTVPSKLNIIATCNTCSTGNVRRQILHSFMTFECLASCWAWVSQRFISFSMSHCKHIPHVHNITQQGTWNVVSLKSG